MRTGLGVGVSADPGRRLPPNVVARFDTGGSIADLVTGYEMGCRLPAANGKYYEDSGDVWRKVGANVLRAGLLEGEGYNASDIVKINPQSVAGMSASADGVLSFENMAEALGEKYAVFGPNMYKLDNLAGATESFVNVSEEFGSTGPRSMFAIVMGKGDIRAAGGGVTGKVSFDQDYFSMVKSEGFTPADTTSRMYVTAAAGEIVYFVVTQAEPGLRCTTPMVGDNTAAPATRASEAGSATNGIYADGAVFTEVWAMLQGGEGAIRWEGAFGFDKDDVESLFGLMSANNNEASLLYVNPSGLFRATDGTNYPLNAYDFIAGEHLKVDVVFSLKDDFLRIDVNGVAGTPTAFAGWNLSAGKIVEAWNFPDGMSMSIGPTRTYYDSAEVA